MESSFLNKCIGYAKAKIMSLRYEKTYGENWPIKYMLLDESRGLSDDLVVVFSSCTRKGMPARYNYVKTLSQIRCAKLYILDHYGPEGRGCYYLGKHGDRQVCDNTAALIEEVKASTGAKRIIYCGSGKGGWAALYFGISDPNGLVVAGAPQYHLGQYFVSEAKKPNGNKELLPYVLGDNLSDAGIANLDILVRSKIMKGASSQTVFLCYSDCEHTYEEHVKPLCFDLEVVDRKIISDLRHFENHNDIGKYFSPFLYDTIRNLVFQTGLENEKC